MSGAQYLIEPTSSLVRYEPPMKLEEYQRQPQDEVSRVLDSLVPPRVETILTPVAKSSGDDGEPSRDGDVDHVPVTWVQRVSRQQCSREEVGELTRKIDEEVKHRQARVVNGKVPAVVVKAKLNDSNEAMQTDDQQTIDDLNKATYLCPVRRQLFMECFDEVIRQTTLNEMERGLLLTRIRDEVSMTLDSYAVKCQAAVRRGQDKQLEVEKMLQKKELNKAKNEVAKLKEKLHEFERKEQIIEQREAEMKLIATKRFEEEIQQLKRQNDQLKRQQDGIRDAKEKSK